MGLVLLFGLELALAEASEVEWTHSRAISELFSEMNVAGTFVSCRQPDGVMTGHNPERAIERLPPASTFKIPHTLIALETGVVSDPGEVFAWDGTPRLFRAWERDMSLAEALSASNVPVYRKIAGRIGRERMLGQLAAFDYGSRQIDRPDGDPMSDFWLVGPLTISAVEQCRFLLRLAGGELPVADQHLQTLRTMLASDVGDGITVYAKTGWVNAPEPGPGWWVGWVEGPFGRTAFALNIDIVDPDMASKRVELGRRALRAMGMLP